MSPRTNVREPLRSGYIPEFPSQCHFRCSRARAALTEVGPQKSWAVPTQISAIVLGTSQSWQLMRMAAVPAALPKVSPQPGAPVRAGAWVIVSGAAGDCISSDLARGWLVAMPEREASALLGFQGESG